MANNEGYLKNAEGEVCILAFNKLTTVPKDHRYHKEILDALEKGDFQKAVDLADQHQRLLKEFIKHTRDNLSIEQSVDGKVLFNGKALDQATGTKAIQMLDRGMPLLPLLKFLEKLDQNPDHTVRAQLFPFLAANDFAITEKGLIVAWKKVHRNPDGSLVDLWTKTLDYTPPLTVTMPRGKVNSDPHEPCAAGLHFATWDFTYNYGGNAVVELLVDPQNVVSIPYSHVDKGRCCAMRINREIVDWADWDPTNPPVPDGAVLPYDYDE